MPLPRYTRSHAVKNTLQSKEETENTLTEKVTSDMKQGLRTLSFLIRFKRNSNNKYSFVALQYVMTDHCIASVQTLEPIVFSYLLKTSGGPLSALTCCVNVRLLSGDKKNIAVNLFSKLGWELGLYYASYDDFHPDILARMYT